MGCTYTDDSNVLDAVLEACWLLARVLLGHIVKEAVSLLMQCSWQWPVLG